MIPKSVQMATGVAWAVLAMCPAPAAADEVVRPKPAQSPAPALPIAWQVRDREWDRKTNETLASCTAEQRRVFDEANQAMTQANRLLREEKATDALTAAEQAAEGIKAVLGENHPRFAAAQHLLGQIHFARESHSLSEAAYRKALELRRRALGEDHPATADTMNNLGLLVLREGNMAEAEKLLRGALELRARLLGVKHVLYAQSENNVGYLCLRQKRYADAEPHLRKALACYEATLGPDHPEYLRSLDNLGQAVFWQQRYGEAATALRQILDTQQRTIGSSHTQYRRTLDNLAIVQRKLVESVRRQAVDFESGKTKAESAPPRPDETDVSKQAQRHWDEVGQAITDLAELQQQRGDWAAAREAWEELSRLGPKLPTKRQWRLVSAQLGSDHVQRVSSLTESQGRRLEESRDLLDKGGALLRKEEYPAAIRALQNAVAIRQELLGEADGDTLAGLRQLAAAYQAKGDDDRAEPVWQQVLQAQKSATGEAHPHYAEALEAVARACDFRLEPKQAEQYRQAAEQIRELTMDVAPTAEAELKRSSDLTLPDDYAGRLSRLARSLHQAGDYASADPLLRKVVELRRKSPGEASAEFADSLNDLATLAVDMGDFAAAERQYLQAKEVLQAAGPKHALTLGVTLHNLGVLYERMEQFDRAEPLLRRDLELTEQRLGRERPEFAHSLASLAFLKCRRDQLEEGTQLYRQALTLYQRLFGERHASTARAINNLGFVLLQQGNFDEAGELLQRAASLRKELLGAQHPDYADSLADQARLYLARKEHDRALSVLREAIVITRHLLDVAATIQSERQQLAMADVLRRRLDLFISLALAASLPGEHLHNQILNWKGTVFSRRRYLIGNRSDAELQSILRDMERISQRLSNLAFASPQSDHDYASWKTSVDELSRRQEQLEKNAAARISELPRDVQPEVASQQVSAALPVGTALVDLMEYRRIAWPDGQRRPLPETRCLLAVIVRRGEKPVAVDLGPQAMLDELIQRWRMRRATRRTLAGPDEDGKELRTHLWLPLEKHLRDAAVVLISPDGAVSQLAWGALPGAEPGTYLIEERSFGLAPVPRLIPEAAARQFARPNEPSVLMVGHVDYARGMSRSPVPSATNALAVGRSAVARERNFSLLPATRAEVVAVRNAFEQGIPEVRARILRAGEATEQAVRELAPRYQWLHIATHGFFASPRELSGGGVGASAAVAAAEAFATRQEVTALHPGLLSGLALAGANRPPAPGEDDGILTALDVADLDLTSTDLVVLSACETALGQTAGGEGVLGLQRSFAVAGARSTITSLWKVDDAATQKLMERFYGNLLARRMGKLAALREAQLWMLSARTRDEAATRGITRERSDEDVRQDPSGRTPPYFWAAFVLGGDWR